MSLITSGGISVMKRRIYDNKGDNKFEFAKYTGQ